LDPFGVREDEDILQALKAVRLAKSNDLVSKLETTVHEGGLNYSVGERQLLNLARALLSKPKVLILDEATGSEKQTTLSYLYPFVVSHWTPITLPTASVDGETDAFIQRMLRTKFTDTTLITVAHRLNTIMDYDLVLVMDQGKAVELGRPADLLARQEHGVFADLVNATGPESSKALRAMADASQ
jgi:ABC-type multidrug transport system fused ATPase/permease subunit